MLEYNLSELARQVRIKGLFSARPSDYENIFCFHNITYLNLQSAFLLPIIEQIGNTGMTVGR